LIDGRVLVTGGTNTLVPGGGASSISNLLNGAQATGEVYNPAANVWIPCGNSMSLTRMLHTQTRMVDGRVACIGGTNGPIGIGGVPSALGLTSIYDPATNLFSIGAPVNPTRWGHRVTLMASGEIFLAGGVNVAGAIILTPNVLTSCLRSTTNGASWSSAGVFPVPLALHGQVLLKNGKCHLSGGVNAIVNGAGTNSNCGTRGAGSASPAATAPMPTPRGAHLAILLADGSVLICGGTINGFDDLTSLLYMPAP
jgi:hypothetical protein